ncbi:hypothetical protein HOK021_44980 [Streptomyces hygroscopicus]|nr:hypothetical protein HOK021_44980 [Streptomyces hygroscopicus]
MAEGTASASTGDLAGPDADGFRPVSWYVSVGAVTWLPRGLPRPSSIPAGPYVKPHQALLREPEPVPVPGCDVCEPCGQEREVARQAGRSLALRSLNGVIAGHPHGRKVRA